MWQVRDSFTKRLPVYAEVSCDQTRAFIPLPLLPFNLTTTARTWPANALASCGHLMPALLALAAGQRHPASWEFLQGYVEAQRRRVQQHPQFYELLQRIPLGGAATQTLA